MPSEGIPPGSINRIIGGFKGTLWLIRQKVIVPLTVYFPLSLCQLLGFNYHSLTATAVSSNYFLMKCPFIKVLLDLVFHSFVLMLYSDVWV